MPYDDNGVRADVITAPDTIIARMHIGVPYEGYFNNTSRSVKRLVIKEIENISNGSNILDIIYSMSENDVNRIFEIPLGLLKILDNAQYSSYLNATINDKRDILKEIVMKEFYIMHTVDSKKQAWEIHKEVKNSIYKPLKAPINVRDENGVWKKTAQPISITPMYIILLSKIADTGLATSSAKVNHIGIPVRSKGDKHRLPYNNAPVKNRSETETRLFGSYGDEHGVFLAEMVDRSGSKDSHELIYENILKAPQPTNIDDVIPREKHPYNETNAMQLINGIVNVSGVDFAYEDNDKKGH